MAAGNISFHQKLNATCLDDATKALQRWRAAHHAIRQRERGALLGNARLMVNVEQAHAEEESAWRHLQLAFNTYVKLLGGK